MGLRFRRTIGLIPGVRVNLGLKSLSVSVGERGAHYTLGTKGGRGTVGVPGSGLSYTEYTPYRRFPAVLGGAIAWLRSHPILGSVLAIAAVVAALVMVMR